MAKEGLNNHVPPSSEWKYLFCRFSADSQVSPVIYAILPFMASTYVLGLSPDRAGHYHRGVDQESSGPPISISRRSRPRCFRLRAMTRAFDLPSDTLQARWAG